MAKTERLARQSLAAGLGLLALLSGSASAAVDPEALPALKAMRVNDAQVVTAGLPSADQFTALKVAGIELVIDLIPPDHPHAPTQEPAQVRAAGMAYANIPVDWQAPSSDNLTRFAELMQQYQGKGVLVHCMANYRASAFYYLYQSQQGQGDLDLLEPWGDLDQAFAEYPQWQRFIEQHRAASDSRSIGP